MPRGAPLYPVEFQSSPGPKAECDIPGVGIRVVPQLVSILTRPEGRVRRFAQFLRRGAGIWAVLREPGAWMTDC